MEFRLRPLGFIAMIMFCSLAIVTYTYRNRIMLRKIKIHLQIYIRLKQCAAFVTSLKPIHKHINIL